MLVILIYRGLYLYKILSSAALKKAGDVPAFDLAINFLKRLIHHIGVNKAKPCMAVSVRNGTYNAKAKLLP